MKMKVLMQLGTTIRNILNWR